jgi:eukaryotic-like serine/threonine-protein kinase
MTGAADRMEMGTDIGQRSRIGDYRLCGSLAANGPARSRSFVAERTGPGGRSQIVALKLRAAPGEDGSRRAAWRARLHSTVELQHPHVVATLEVGEIDRTGFVAQEYVAGEDLAAVFAQLGRAGLPVEIALVAIQQCLSTLHKGQGMRGPLMPGGLVHGAIRPSNILVTYDGPTRLMDFAAPVAQEVPGLAYAAPEQLLGEAGDQQTDVFSMGAVLWEALAGRRLFGGGEIGVAPEAIREAIINRPIPSLRGLRPEIPADLETTIARALERDRQRRFTSALEMARALEVVARRYTRPTAEGVGLWLRGLFGSERARLRRLIAEGSGVGEALARLAEITGAPPVASGQPPSRPSRSRPLWVNSRTPVETMAVVNTPTPSLVEPLPDSVVAAVDTGTTAERPAAGMAPVLELVPPTSVASERPVKRSRAGLWITSGAVLVAVLGLGGWMFAGRRSGIDPKAAVQTQLATTGGLRIDSQPPGAHIVVDGDPSGRQTPALLDGLPAGRTLDIQLQKDGFQTVTRRIEVTAGKPRLHSFTLVEDWGLVVLEGLPAAAKVYVDDLPAEGGERLSLGIGKRRIRIETADDVLYAGEVDVHRGEQRLVVAPKARKP